MLNTPAFQTIDTALATGKIGQVVAVRVIANLAEQANELDSLMKLLVTKAENWIGDSSKTTATLDRQSSHCSQLLQTSQGRSALVSGGLHKSSGEPFVEVIVFGNHGTLSWEPGSRWAPRTDESNRDSQNDPESITPHGPTAGQSPPYGVLLIAGDHTHQPGYAEALLADGRCHLVGVVDEDDVTDERAALNQRLAERLNIPLLPSLADALTRPDVDIVSVCAEPYRRGRIITQAARAGKHLYLDKPLAGSVTDARAIVAAVRESGVVAHMFSQVNWDPAQRIRAVVESGELGDIVAIHCDVCFAKGHGGTADLSRRRVEHDSPTRFELPDAKRELTNVGVYPIAMLLWLLKRDVKSVHATTGNYFFAEHQANDMEDFGQMLLEFDGGITATVSAGRAGWQSHPGFGLHRVCLVGSAGTVTVDAHRPRVEVWSDGDPWSPPPRDPDDPMGMWAPLPDSPFKADPKNDWLLPTTPTWVTDAKHFLDCIEQGKQSEMSVDFAAAASEILFAAYRSAATGKSTELS